MVRAPPGEGLWVLVIFFSLSPFSSIFSLLAISLIIIIIIIISSSITSIIKLFLSQPVGFTIFHFSSASRLEREMGV